MVVGGGEGITLNLHKITPDIKREAELQGFKRGKITPDIKREAELQGFKRGKITPGILREA